jgi:hypothetical protein
MNNIQSPRTDDAGIEQLIQAKGKTAARVTPADIAANVASEHYFTANDGVVGGFFNTFGGGCRGSSLIPSELSLLTFCVLVLKNGFTVTGESACASPENFDADIGKKVARENAVNKIWPLLGFQLKSRLAEDRLGTSAIADLPDAEDVSFDLDKLRNSAPGRVTHLPPSLGHCVMSVIEETAFGDEKRLVRAIADLQRLGWHLERWCGRPDVSWALLPLRAGVGEAMLLSMPQGLAD